MGRAFYVPNKIGKEEQHIQIVSFEFPKCDRGYTKIEDGKVPTYCT